MRLSALLTSVERWIDPRVIMGLEGLHWHILCSLHPTFPKVWTILENNSASVLKTWYCQHIPQYSAVVPTEMIVFPLQNLITLASFDAKLTLRAVAHKLRQDKRQDMDKWQSFSIHDSSASWLRTVCGGFHNLIRFNCVPFFASCHRHRVLTVTYLDACRCAEYLRHESSSPTRTLGSWVRIPLEA
jgi:hypothetical protein